MQNIKCKIKYQNLQFEICNLKFAISQQRGFTLVELLVAMAIASVVGMAGVSLFSTSNWAYKVNEDVAEAQQNGRVSMERLAKDIRTAGFGLPDPPFTLSIGGQNWTSPITVTTSGGSGGSDSITILGIGYEAGTLVGGPVENTGTSTYLCYSSTGTERFFGGNANNGSSPYSARTQISLNGSTYILLATNQVRQTCNGTDIQLQLSSPATLGRAYPNGTPVYIIQAVTYSIVTNDASASPPCTSANPCLRSTDLTELRGVGSQTLAEDIEDIQFAYGVDADRDGKMDSSTLSNDPADDSSILAVRATVVAKTRNKDMKGSTFTRPAIEDHSASASDNYRRRTLTKIIKLRNPRTGG